MSRTRKALASICALTLLSYGASSSAQFTSGPPSPPTASLKDDNGVDMASGSTSFPITLLSIGDGELGMPLTVNYQDPGLTTYGWASANSLQAYRRPDPLVPGYYYYFIGLKSDAVNTYGGNVNSADGGFISNGGTTFTDRNGAVMQLGSNGFATSLTYPTGKMLRYQGAAGGGGQWSALQNNGLLVKRDSVGNYKIINLAYEYCNPDPSVSCSLTNSWPTASEVGSGNVWTITDASGGKYQFTLASYASAIASYHDKGWAPGATIDFKRCSRTAPDCGYYSVSTNTFYPMYDRVETATKNGVTWTFTYVWNVGPYGYMYKTTSPRVRSFMGWTQGVGYPISYVDERGKVISFDATVAARVREVHYPENNFESYLYDARGNLTDIKKFTKTDSSTPYAVIHADYDVTCVYPAKCNKPNYYVDANSNRTDLTYDNATGLLTSEMGPAVGGIRPVKRYHYVLRSAWYLGPSGGYIQDPNGIWLLATMKICRTGQTDIANDTCLIAGDEVVTAYDYGPNSGPNNLWLRGVAVTADGVTQRVCYAYNRFGKRISETRANANSSSCS